MARRSSCFMLRVSEAAKYNSRTSQQFVALPDGTLRQRERGKLPNNSVFLPCEQPRRAAVLVPVRSPGGGAPHSAGAFTFIVRLTVIHPAEVCFGFSCDGNWNCFGRPCHLCAVAGYFVNYPLRKWRSSWFKLISHFRASVLIHHVC